jgi:hypothetical protein
VDLGDAVGQKQAPDLAVARTAELDLVIGRAAEPDEATGRLLRITQVVQRSDNLELPFGSVVSNSS